MREQKQSFLERLTGTRTIAESDEGKRSTTDGRALAEKPWSTRIDQPIAVAPKEDEKAEELDEEVEGDAAEDEDAPEDEDSDEEAGLAVDIYESDHEIIVQSMIAGVTPENLHVAITRDHVTISGKRVAPEGIPEERYIERELYWGSFSREIELPFEIDTEGAEAVEKYGLLIIRLPKLDKSKTQELKVKSVD